jgi:hypothetical protein
MKCFQRCGRPTVSFAAFITFGSVILFAAFAPTMNGQAPGELQIAPIRESGQSVTGAFEGWYPNPDGTFSLLMGYLNRNSMETLDIPIGPKNRIEPGGPDQGQPTHFLQRRQWGVFRIVVPKDYGAKKLTWTIVANGQETSIPMSLNPLWVVEPFQDAGNGNTPPVVRLEANGPSFTGPPHGVAQTLATKISDALLLTLWFKDDQPPVLIGRGAAFTPITWSKFRGPGEVAFENAKPPADSDGKTTTSVKFTIPGEYILRAQANDATGDGGGGFQCCWTNVHVKVNVNPNAKN